MKPSPVSTLYFSRHIVGSLAAAFLLLLPGIPVRAQLPASVGTTRVAQWKDDRTAVFLLMFDDSWPSHFQVAVPELVKRGMVATFYVCPGKGEYKSCAKQWEETVPSLGMVYGDHTMTHQGVKNPENAEWEIGECARVIRKITPGKENHLVSYGQPGVPPDAWNITGDQLREILKEHHLISRPPFTDHGAVYHLKTKEQMLALADKAIEKKGLEYLVIHGVERITPNWGYQDMWPLKQDIFLPLLDGLKERSDKGQLWITDHISSHKYETERTTASVKVDKANYQGIQLTLTSQADPQFYDLPLTLVTNIPPNWPKCQVVQGSTRSVVAPKNGQLVFDAIPNGGPILLQVAIGQ